MATEMLRDLRVTTAPVETRPSGESVTLLGELTFSEDAFAEVAEHGQDGCCGGEGQRHLLDQSRHGAG